MSDPSLSDPKPIGIELARVGDVNISQYSVDLYTEESYRKLFDVPFSVPYVNPDRGTGMQFMPEAGACCWVAWPSQPGASPFVLGWYGPLDDRGGFKGLRRPLEPGDCIMETPDENYVWIRRGGIVEVAATPICRRFYLPLDNLIRDIASSYRMQLVGGAWDWSIARENEKDESGHQQVRYALGIKEYADHNKVMVALDVAGAVGKDPDVQDPNLLSSAGVIPAGTDSSERGALRLRVFDPDGEFKVTTQLDISKDGTVDIQLEKSFNLTVQENIALNAVKAISLTANEENIEVTAKQRDIALKASMGKILINATDALEMSSGKGTTISGAPVDVKTNMSVFGRAGGNPTGVVLDTFLKLFNGHVHTPPSPPLQPNTGPPVTLAAELKDATQVLKAAPGGG